MSVSPEALRQLHRIHRQRTDLRSRLDAGPKQVAAAQSMVAAAQRGLDDAKGEQKRIRMASDEKQLQLKEREDRIKDLGNKLNTAASNKEYQAIKEQIAADEQANSVLSDEILELLEELDVQNAKVKEEEGSVAATQEKADVVVKRVSDEQPNLEGDLDRVNSELKQVEESLPADFRKEYQRIAKARGEDTLAQVEGEVCGGCYQMLTPQMMNELSLSRPVFCKSCGCLLYLPEDRTPGQ